jgi:hypothetical protein
MGLSQVLSEGGAVMVSFETLAAADMRPERGSIPVERPREDARIRARRVMIFSIDENSLVEMLQGHQVIRLVGIPEGALVEGVYYEFHRKSFAVRLWHPSFPVCRECEEMPRIPSFGWVGRWEEIPEEDRRGPCVVILHPPR